MPPLRLSGCSAVQAPQYQITELLLHIDLVSTQISPKSSEKTISPASSDKSSGRSDDAPSDRKRPRKKVKIVLKRLRSF